MRLCPPYPILQALPVLLGVLIAGAVVPVIVATFHINRSNAHALLGARAELLVDGLENQLTTLLDPVEAQFQVARDHIETEGLWDDDVDALELFVEGVLTGAPQLAGMGVIRPDGSMRRWQTGRSGAIEEPSTAVPLGGDALAGAQQTDGILWAAPFASEVLGDVIMNPRIRLALGDGQTGVLVGAVTGVQLTEYVTDLSNDTVTAYVLYDRTGLIAYPGRREVAGSVPTGALPSIATSSNPILRDIWKEQNPLTQTGDMGDTQGHWAPIEGVPHIFFYREISGYGPQNLLVGVSIASSESWLFRRSAAVGVGVGIVFLILAIGAGTAVARRLAKPFVQFDDALGNLQNMEFEKAVLPEMQRSPILEMATSANRLGMAARALARINQYVPRSLAKRLMQSPEKAAIANEREVTIMFIDLEGFSDFASRRPASDIAEWLNALFAAIGPLIEDSGGVIDKYTGDGLMAFWGAPEVQHDHVARTVMAACTISKMAEGQVAILGQTDSPRLRVGLHSGVAIVGNLGFEGRVNYTLVGQAVNRAERVEQSLRGICPEKKVVIGLSGELWDAHGPFDQLAIAETIEAKSGPVLVVEPKPRNSLDRAIGREHIAAAQKETVPRSRCT